jgi:hypothetical protein
MATKSRYGNYACPSGEKSPCVLNLVVRNICVPRKHFSRANIYFSAPRKHFQYKKQILSTPHKHFWCANNNISALEHLFCAPQTFSSREHLFGRLLKNIYFVLFWECRCAVMRSTSHDMPRYRKWSKMKPPSLYRVYSAIMAHQLCVYYY